MESIIKVENVSKKFGADTALNNVSIEFESGKRAYIVYILFDGCAAFFLCNKKCSVFLY